MDLLLSIALLAAFIVAVDAMLGADASGPAGRLTLLFASPDQLGWPRGVQETYERMTWNWSMSRPAAGAPATGVTAADLDHLERSGPEIIDDAVDPVPVTRVRLS
jgi:hypothetical protein